jgi:bacterioferritin-associated ferredoxin
MKRARSLVNNTRQKLPSLQTFISVLFLLCLCLVTLPNQGVQASLDEKDRFIETAQYILNFTGGQSQCGVCQPTVYQVNNFACSDGSNGNWNEGKLSYIDTLPPTANLVDIRFELAGLFDCKLLGTAAYLLLTLDGTTVYDLTGSSLLPAYPDCECPNCVNIVGLPSVPPPPDYKLGQKNTVIVSIQNDDSVCMSSVTVTVRFTRPSPELSAILPNNGVVGSVTHLEVEGNSFGGASKMVCLFIQSNQSVAATNVTWANTTLLRCEAPPSIDQVGYVGVRVIYEGVIESNELEFLYTEYPNITSIEPKTGTRGTTIIVSGHDLINSSFISCAFGNLYSPGVFLSPSEISCVVPRSSDTPAGPVPFRLSFNSQQYSNATLIFTYTAEARGFWENRFGYIVGGTILGIFAISVLVLYLAKQYKKIVTAASSSRSEIFRTSTHDERTSYGYKPLLGDNDDEDEVYIEGGFSSGGSARRIALRRRDKETFGGGGGKGGLVTSILVASGRRLTRSLSKLKKDEEEAVTSIRAPYGPINAGSGGRGAVVQPSDQTVAIREPTNLTSAPDMSSACSDRSDRL